MLGVLERCLGRDSFEVLPVVGKVRAEARPSEAVTGYGVRPMGPLLILDFDRPTDSRPAPPLDEQVALLSRFLGVTLPDTFWVRTPSGGRHYYLFLPSGLGEDDGLLWRGNLDRYAHAIGVILGVEDLHLSIDVRSGASNQYVVGPDYLYSGEELEGAYVLMNPVKPLRIPADFAPLIRASVTATNVLRGGAEDASECFASMTAYYRKYLQQHSASGVPVKFSRRGVSQVKKAAQSLPPKPVKRLYNENTQTYAGPRLNHVPGPVVNMLRKSLDSREGEAYHPKRAYVMSALGCCYSIEAVADVCTRLGIDRDTYLDRRLTERALLKDLQRFKSNARSYHGLFCPRNDTRPQLPDAKTLADNLAAKIDRIKSGRVAKRSKIERWVDFRVIDTVAVHKALAGRKANGGKLPQQYFDAMSVVDYFLQPMCNVGAQYNLLAYTAVEKRLGFSISRVRQALRLLRERGVISVASKQAEGGIAPTYTVNKDFLDEGLTRKLRCLWSGRNKGVEKGSAGRAIIFDRNDGVFRDVFTGRRIAGSPRSGRSFYRLRRAMLPAGKFVGSGAALSYLKEEKAFFGLVGDKVGALANVVTGEILESEYDRLDVLSNVMSGLSLRAKGFDFRNFLKTGKPLRRGYSVAAQRRFARQLKYRKRKKARLGRLISNITDVRDFMDKVPPGSGLSFIVEFLRISGVPCGGTGFTVRNLLRNDDFVALPAGSGEVSDVAVRMFIVSSNEEVELPSLLVKSIITEEAGRVLFDFAEQRLLTDGCGDLSEPLRLSIDY